MIHLTSVSNTADPTQSFFNGLQQGFATQSGAVMASVDVDPLNGPVFLGLFSGNGSTLITPYAVSSGSGWQTLTITVAAGTDPNLLALYSYSTTGTGEFYADNASVVAASIPEPTSGVLALIGMSAAALRVRKARRQIVPRRAGPST